MAKINKEWLEHTKLDNKSMKFDREPFNGVDKVRVLNGSEIVFENINLRFLCRNSNQVIVFCKKGCFVECFWSALTLFKQ